MNIVSKERKKAVIDTSLNKSRLAGSVSSNIDTLLTLCAFNFTGLVWKGASEIVGKFLFTMPSGFSFPLGIPKPSPDPNYCPVISWKVSEGVVTRYKLWEDIGEILYVPLYNGELIPASFALEIWSINATTAVQAIDLFALLSIITKTSLDDLCNCVGTGEVTIDGGKTDCSPFVVDFSSSNPSLNFLVTRTDECTGYTTSQDEPAILFPDLACIVVTDQTNAIFIFGAEDTCESNILMELTGRPTSNSWSFTAILQNDTDAPVDYHIVAAFANPNGTPAGVYDEENLSLVANLVEEPWYDNLIPETSSRIWVFPDTAAGDGGLAEGTITVPARTNYTVTGTFIPSGTVTSLMTSQVQMTII